MAAKIAGKMKGWTWDLWFSLSKIHGFFPTNTSLIGSLWQMRVFPWELFVSYLDLYTPNTSVTWDFFSPMLFGSCANHARRSLRPDASSTLGLLDLVDVAVTVYLTQTMSPEKIPNYKPALATPHPTKQPVLWKASRGHLGFQVFTIQTAMNQSPKTACNKG